jgi:hypothetical protein
MHEPFRMMNILPVSPAPQTGPELLAGLGNVIAFHTQYLVVLDVQLDRAAPPAVECRCSTDDPDTVIHGFKNI